MTRSRISLILLAAMQSFAWVAIALSSAVQEKNAVGMLVFGVIISQATLAALAILATRVSVVLRGSIAIAMLGSALLTSYSFYLEPGDSDGPLTLLMLAACLFTAWFQTIIVLLICRLLVRMRLQQETIIKDRGDWSQIHLSHLLVAISMAAALLATGRLVLSPFPTSADFGAELGWLFLLLTIMTTITVAATVMGLLCVLNSRRPYLGTATALLGLLLLNVVEHFATSSLEPLAWDAVNAVLRQMTAFTWTVMSAAILRWGGWRLLPGDSLARQQM